MTATASTATWGSAISLQDIADWLAGRSRVVLATHTRPDGDAVGSTVALVRALRRRGIEAKAWYMGAPPNWLDVICASDEFSLIGRDGDVPAGDPDGVLITDTGTWSQLRELESWLRDRHEIITVIDHHLSGDPELAPRRLVDTTVAAVSETVSELCALLLGLDGVSALPADIASACYLGLATDTGWFRHSNVTPDVLRKAADLLEAGADHASIYNAIERQERPSRLRLLTRALASLVLYDDGRIALMGLRGQDFADSGAESNESGGFVDVPGTLKGVKVSGILTEISASDGTVTKISLRSREDSDAVDVNAVARRLGGGGHARAAGARLQCDLESAKRQVLEALEAEMG